MKQIDLSGTPYAGWQAAPMAGDASARQYVRLTDAEGHTVILMQDAPENLLPFIKIAQHLRHLDLRAPGVLLHDPDQGMLILEDLGPWDVAQVVACNPAQEGAIYGVAVEAIAQYQSAAAPADLTEMSLQSAVEMLDPLFEWYAPALSPQERGDIQDEMRLVLAPVFEDGLALSLRDYHAENLIWRPDQAGLDRLGILDFQDAFLAPRDYDLASLLRDARRDVSASTAKAMIAQFAGHTDRSPKRVERNVAALSLQRNLRILGIFARLIRRDGKPRYASFIPRVQSHVRTDGERLGKMAKALAPVLSKAVSL